MQPAYVLIIIMLYAAFGCMFLFASWQRAGKFARLLAQSWLLEAFRACIVLMELNHAGGSVSHWHSFSDCLNLLATWWLVAGIADLAGVRLPARLGPLCLGIGVPVILALRYFASGWLEAGLGVTHARADFLGTFIELALLFAAVGLARLMVLAWLIRLWRKTRLPGAMLAIVFGVPYMIFAIAVPVQFYFGYYPEWIYLTWVVRILGFSLGMVMLLFDRQMAQQREREQAYRTLVETSHDLIWSVDATGRWTFVNAAVRRIYGYEPAEMLGRPFTYFESPEQAQKDLQVFAGIKAGTPAFNYETVHRRKDGSAVHLSFNTALLLDQHGNVVGTTGTAQDITERKLAGAARERSLAQMMATLDSTADGILVVNSEGRIETYNQLFTRMWRLPDDVLASQNDASILQCMLGQLRESEPYLDKVRHLRAHAREESIDTLAFRDGRVFERYSRPQLIGEQVVGRVWSFRDITESRIAEAALRESEVKFHAVFAQSPLAIVLTTLPEGQVADANLAAEHMLGWALAEVRGRTTTEMGMWANPVDRERYLQLLQSEASVNGFEALMRAKDGTELVVLFHGRVIRIGGRAYVLNSLVDITERKRVEKALHTRTAFFEAQVDSALDAILVVDSSGRKVLQNKRMAEVWGIPPEVANDKDDAPQVKFVTSQTKNPQQFVEKVIHLYSHPTEISRDIIELVDGRVLDRYSAPVCDRDGKYFGRIWTFRDVTESRKAEELVRHLAAFPELNPNPVLEFNGDGSLAYHNPAAVSMARKVGCSGIEQLLPSGCPAIVAECLASGRPRLRLETARGRNRLSWSFYPIAGRQVVHCYVGDITDRQSLEEQLRQAQKMEAIGQLAGGVAHDFNNMLTAIIGHLGLLRDNPQVTAEIDESLGEISTAAHRAAKLTDQLLAFSRRQVLSTSDLDLNEVVTHLTKMLRRILGEHVSMQLDFAPEHLTFHGDAGLMEQVLVNLAVNARDAMPGGGTLRIETSSERRSPPATPEQADPSPAAYVRLTVADTGTGIPLEIREKIFEPFFTTKEVGKGTGLGLATVFGIVQQHHGWIEVESEMGQGTSFHIFLPKLAHIAAAPVAPPPVAVPRGRNEVVLLVEDELSVQEMGAEALRRQGYRVLTAANGPDALEVWSGHKTEIELLLTDMIMPAGISGGQLARHLLQEKPALRVVYSSGYNSDIAGRELKLTDGVNYLAKPYELDRLFRTVRAALDGTKSRSPF